MDQMLMRDWKQHGKEDRSTRSYLVCDTVNALSSISNKMNIHNQVIYLYWFTFFPQRFGNRAGWSGSSGPGDTMNNNCRSARRNSRTRGSERSGSVLLWKRSASRGWRRRKWVLMVEMKNFYFLVKADAFTALVLSNITTKSLFSWIKERYESAVRRTVEKSQKVQQSLSQYSRGRKLTKNSK